ncbi:cache domain-containing sensor histidine kinase [Paenibacillus nasutitermitis]|uniref:histidine kinase n=1 Tax=Paenibacillus nasutitermitis TaxID=1652958 RepID=A0A917DLD3_9BACL|nr:sensor histidine kinase [Paenibacillus nasutitermitis]GGD46607.1 sensor histidine kinase [Paenibacillus nasutitermitis]
MNSGKQMRQIWSKVSDMRMERKLLLVFLLLVTLPLTFIGAVSYRNYSHSIEQNTIDYSTNMLSNMMDRVDDYIEDMVRISTIPAYQDDIRQNLNRSNRYYEQRAQSSAGGEGSSMPADLDLLLSIQRGIGGNISYINTIKRGANSVYIFDQYGNGYYSAKSGTRANIKESYGLWEQKLRNTTGEAVLFSTQKYTSNMKSIQYAFTVVRKIIDISLKDVGLIAVDANISVIEDQVLKLDNVTHGKSFIVDTEGNVVYDSGKKLLATNIADQPMLQHASGDKGSFYLDEDGERHLYIFSTSSQNGWKMIISIPVKELTRDSVVIRNVTWIATFLTIGIALLISVFFSFALTKPLRTMIRLMRRVQGGDFNVKFQVRRRDEIGQLGSQFNQMILQIDQLIADIYVMETKKKEAELHALQSQINPHFMYNTLESIRMAAELNDDRDAANMLAILGRLLRYSISDLHEEVTLASELSHVRYYVELLNYRYRGRFELVIDVAQPLMDYSIIKLVLQPIVENAIYHGLDDNKPLMHINIKGEYAGSQVIVRISDDGVGMSLETLERLNADLSGQTGAEIIPARKSTGSSTGGIGLANVNERIRLHYGSGFGIKVFSEPGAGTVVELLLPREEED